ncbi:MAG: RNA polymerase sigma factor [bacterium]|nr:RNA polymerase sigma factor [bacterium]
MDATTYTRVLNEHRDRVFSRALYVLRDREDAEDVTQEAFLRLWRTGEAIPADRAGYWLQRVVHNLCIDQTRRRKVVRARFGQPDTEATDRLVAPDSGHWATDLDGNQEALLNAMAALPAETRSVMMMHYYQGMKLREIAACLGKTVAALKVQIHRARKTLRPLLEAQGCGAPTARSETG